MPFFLLLLMGTPGAETDHGAELAALQETLNAALADDAPIVLTEGDDFEAPHGAVIFMSRDEGSARLMALARSETDEVSVLFLPRWHAWITQSAVRTSARVTSDVRYVRAAVACEPEVQLWHTHNTVWDSEAAVAPGSEREWRRWYLVWSTPAGADLATQFWWGMMNHKTRTSSVVAGYFGTFEFRSVHPMPDTEVMDYLMSSIYEEARTFRAEVAHEPPERLAELAKRHEGIFRFRFTPVP